jgi:hypothetical protein
VRPLHRALSVALVATALAPIVYGCSLGQGQGAVTGTLNVPDCWAGHFDLHPDFFAAVPGNGPNGVKAPTTSLELRIQNGGDFETFSDGLLIDVDDVGVVRGDPAGDGTQRPSLLGTPLVVGLSSSVVPSGVPITPVANPSIVHAALYLDRTCRTQHDALYALDAVTITDEACDRPDGGEPPLPCGGPATASPDGGPAPVSEAGTGTSDASSEAGGGPASAGAVRQSTITFAHLFDGNPDESNAEERLTNVTQFDFYLGDPRETCPGGQGPPPRCRGHLTGWFSFYFQRGRPAQPFP